MDDLDFLLGQRKRFISKEASTTFLAPSAPSAKELPPIPKEALSLSDRISFEQIQLIQEKTPSNSSSWPSLRRQGNHGDLTKDRQPDTSQAIQVRVNMLPHR